MVSGSLGTREGTPSRSASTGEPRFGLSHALALTVLVALSLYAGYLRLQDPLSTPVIGAEDPFTHIVFTKEHLKNGYFGDSIWIGTGLYPPGLHALTGAAIAIAGYDLYDFARFFPVVLGVMSVVGTYLLVARYAGVAGGAAAALLMAQAPEHIFRTNLFFPTALDMALMPFFYLGLLMLAVDGERAGGAALMLTTGFALTYAHPWTGFILCAVGGAFLVINYLSRIPHHRDGSRNPKTDIEDHAIAAGMLVPLGLFTLDYNERYDGDKGFLGTALGKLSGILESTVGSAFLGYLILGVVLAAAVSFVYRLSFGAKPEPGRAMRAERVLLLWAVPGLLIGASIAWGMYSYVEAHGHELPIHVNYKAMFGVPLILLALAGIALAFGSLNPAGLVGALTAIVLFPVTVADLFNSWYLPHRTVIYVLLGGAIAAGAGVGVLADRIPVSLTPGRFKSASRGVMTVAAIVAVAGYVHATPASTYEWYRLYDANELAFLEETAAFVQSEENVRIAAPNWQSNLLLRALADGAEDRMMWGEKLFKDPAWRDRFLANRTAEGVTLYLIVDSHLLKSIEKKPDQYNADWLRDGRWVAERTCCDGGITLYRYTASGQGGA